MSLIKCSHTKKQYIIYRKTPLNTKVRGFVSIAKYYMYYAPNIDCKHSVGRLEGESGEIALTEMLNGARMRKQYKFFQRLRTNWWDEYCLEGESFCVRCPRLVCKQNAHESELTSLLRHIRNSFAHGLIYVWRENGKGTAFIVLEDYEKNGKTLSARMVLTDKILNDWKAILDSHIAVGE